MLQVSGGASVGTTAPSPAASAPAAGGLSSGGATTGTAATSSAGAGVAPGAVTTVPATPGQPIVLTLDQVVNIAVNSNTNVVLARQRYSEAVEGVNQINAQGKPQLGSNIADTYSTFAESSAAFGPVVANPVVPTGTTIPTITDSAANFSSAYGIGTASSGGTFGSAYGSPLATTGSSLPAANSALPGGSGSTALPGLSSGSGIVTGAPGAGTTSVAPSTTGPNTPTSGSSPTTSMPPPGGTSTSDGSQEVAPPAATAPAATTAPNAGSGGSPTATTPSGTTAAPGTSLGPSNGGVAPGSGSSTSTAPGLPPDSNSGTASPGSNSASPSTTGVSYNLMPMPLILQNYVTESSTPAVVAEAAQPASHAAAIASDAAPTIRVADAAAAKAAPTRQADQGTTTEAEQVAVTNNDKVNNYGARINLSQYIDAFGLLGAARDVEKLNKKFYALDIDRTQNEVALSAKNLFFNVILAEQEVATDQEQVADSTESVRVTQALVQQGQAAGFDLLSAQTTLANNEQLLTNAKNQLSFAVSDLDYLIGVDPNTPIQLVPPTLPPLNEAVDLSQSTAVALQRRPELIQANNNVYMAQRLVKVASEGTTPAIGLVGTYGYNSTSTLTGPTNEGLISAQIQVPFSDGGATRSRVREAKEVLQGQLTTRDELKLSIALEVRQAYLNVQDGQAQAATAQSGVNLAVETLRVANVQYSNGVGTILDVENAQAQLATARTNLANAQYTYQTALASLVRAIGSR